MMNYNGILFRIEDVDGLDPNLRTYTTDEYTPISVRKERFDEGIAELISAEVNGSKNRMIHSYSKSLATCLLKYNKYGDNELHLFMDNCDDYNMVSYRTINGDYKWKSYDICERASVNALPLFNKSGIVHLTEFVIDISDNNVLEMYLQKYLYKGRKRTASPEKDNEVVVLNPVRDIFIRNYMDTVYVMYALQLKYGFLSHPDIYNAFVCEVDSLCRVGDFQNNWERCAINQLASYFHYSWEMEKNISEKIYKSTLKQPHISAHYDGILQFYDIFNNSFPEACRIMDGYVYNDISVLALKWCSQYLNIRKYNHIL